VISGGRDTTTPALTTMRGCGAGEAPGSSGDRLLIGGDSTVVCAVAVDAKRAREMFLRQERQMCCLLDGFTALVS